MDYSHVKSNHAEKTEHPYAVSVELIERLVCRTNDTIGCLILFGLNSIEALHQMWRRCRGISRLCRVGAESNQAAIGWHAAHALWVSWFDPSDAGTALITHSRSESRL